MANQFSTAEKITHDENELELIDKGPFDSITVFLVFIRVVPPFYEGIAD